ncbi:MAG: DUF4173 domain-containing protein [Pseudomonadota bacterium]
MTLPTRLVNDGWWLCEPATAAPPFRTPSPHHARNVLMTLTSFIAPGPSLRPHALPRRLLLAAGLTAFADWLFYGHTIGLSFALFLAVLVGAALLARRPSLDRRHALGAAALLVAALLPLVETFNPVSLILGVLGTTIVVSWLTNPFFDGASGIFQGIRTLLVVGPFRLLPDLVRVKPQRLDIRPLAAWIIPLLLGGIFLKLFAAANPLIEHWLQSIALSWLLSQISGPRLLFWAITLSLVWPFVAARWRRRWTLPITLPPLDTIVDTSRLTASGVFGPTAILQSLVLFNLLFAVQTVLDMVYLWGGAALPDGMTYAAYAHRGAYPLIVTALLAAGFILMATYRPPARYGRLIRGLVIAWTAQNVMLVISSMLRLDLYIQVYTLTYWRVAAFIWMLLVAIGLVLIVTRMALDLSNRWLILSNLTALALTLYASAFVNMPALIADYNVAHSREMAGSGPALDVTYLLSLGPQALPAIDRYLQSKGGAPATFDLMRRDQLAAILQGESGSWRSWSLRGWRLQRRLAPAGAAPRPVSNSAVKQDRWRG